MSDKGDTVGGWSKKSAEEVTRKISDDAELSRREGWLTKQGGSYKSWKRRYFVLVNSRLEYYKSEKLDPANLKGSIPLAQISGCSKSEGMKEGKANKGKVSFKINVRTSRGFYLILADNETDATWWMTDIRTAVKDYVTGQRRFSDAYATRPHLSSIGGNDADEEDDAEDVASPRIQSSPPKLASGDLGSTASLGSSSSSSSASDPVKAEERKERHRERKGRELLKKVPVLEAPSQAIEEEEIEERSKALSEATQKGNFGAVQALLGLGATPTHQNEEEGFRTPLHVACGIGAAQGGSRRAKIVALLLRNAKHIDLPDSRGWTPLHEAAYYGNDLCVHMLIQRRAKVRSKDKNGCTPAYVAVISGQVACAVALVKRGCRSTHGSSRWRPIHLAILRNMPVQVRSIVLEGDTSGKDNEPPIHVRGEGGLTPLHLAACVPGAGEPKGLVSVLLAAGAKVDARDARDKTPIHLAASAGNCAVIAALAEAGANVGAVDKYGKTALHTAAGMGRAECVKQLIECTPEADRAAAVGAKDECGFTPLHMAAIHGQVECIRALVDAGADAEAKAVEGLTPLYLLAHTGVDAGIRLLVENGVKVDATVEGGITPLHEAVTRGFESTARLLLDLGADINAVDQSENTPLHRAISAGAAGCTKLLLDVGKDAILVNALNIEGLTPLAMASSTERLDLLYLLLDGGADPHQTAPNAASPMHLAAANSRIRVVRELVERGCPCDVPIGDNEETPLLVAIRAGAEDVVAFLLKRGALSQRANSEGWTPLHEACAKSRHVIVDLLLADDVGVDAADEEGTTPLHVSCINGSAPCVMRLLMAGANPNQEDETSGSRPLFKAAFHGHIECALLVIANGALLDTATTELLGGLMKVLSGGESASSSDKKGEAAAGTDAGASGEVVLAQKVASLEESLSTERAQHFTTAKQLKSQVQQKEETIQRLQTELAEQKTKNSRGVAKAAGGGAATAGTSDKAAEERMAREYLQKVQTTLSKEEFSRFQRCLRTYKLKQMDITELINQVRELFGKADYHELRAGFIAFVPKKNQQQYSDFLSSVQ